MSESTTGTTETLRMCVTCGRMHSLRAQRCGSCRHSFVVNGSQTRRLAREDEGGMPLFEAARRPLSRSPGPTVSRRLIPRRGIGRRSHSPTAERA